MYTGAFTSLPLKTVRGRYDFATDGGVVGDIPIMRDFDIPIGAVILGGYAEVMVVPTSGGAGSLALKVEGAADLVAAAVVSGAPWSTVGRKSIIPAFTGASSVKTTALRKITATVAAADLTAGRVDVILYYLRPMD